MPFQIIPVVACNAVTAGCNEIPFPGRLLVGVRGTVKEGIHPPVAIGDAAWTTTIEFTMDSWGTVTHGPAAPFGIGTLIPIPASNMKIAPVHQLAIFHIKLGPFMNCGLGKSDPKDPALAPKTGGIMDITVTVTTTNIATGEIRKEQTSGGIGHVSFP
jgi:hypothetical protein